MKVFYKGRKHRTNAVGEYDQKTGELNARTSGNIIVELTGDKSLIGTFQNVKITQARNWILKGEII